MILTVELLSQIPVSLFCRLSESNLSMVSAQIEELYMSNSRNGEWPSLYIALQGLFLVGRCLLPGLTSSLSEIYESFPKKALSFSTSMKCWLNETCPSLCGSQIFLCKYLSTHLPTYPPTHLPTYLPIYLPLQPSFTLTRILQCIHTSM